MLDIENILILEDQNEGYELLKAVALELQPHASVSRCHTINQFERESHASYSLVLADLHLDDGVSIAAIASIKSRLPELPIVVTTLYSDDELVFEALSAGADGYLLKSEGQQRLCFYLQRFLNGEPPISPMIARKVMAFFRAENQAKVAAGDPSPDPDQRFADLTSEDQPTGKNERRLLSEKNLNTSSGVRLTPRETQVLKLIATGKMTKQVAAILEISAHTVNDIIKSIYRKLGIRSRAEATLHATRQGII